MGKLTVAKSETDTGMVENALLLGIDLGTSRSSIVSMNGARKTIESYVGWPRDAVSRKLFANALVQWDDVSNSLQSNIRVDWIHTPGSDLFVVLDTGYLTGPLTDPRDPRWLRRTGVVKLTYLMAF